MCWCLWLALKTEEESHPVQCIPYKGLTDAKVRELANKLIVEMTKREMHVAGEYIIPNLWLI